jgi:hypothetical protein
VAGRDYWIKPEVSVELVSVAVTDEVLAAVVVPELTEFGLPEESMVVVSVAVLVVAWLGLLVLFELYRYTPPRANIARTITTMITVVIPSALNFLRMILLVIFSLP